MSYFKVLFDNAWLMLLLIPAIAVALWPYFRMEKKYRRTRYRIISLVSHIIITVLAISVLSGARFAYGQPSVENEMFILVDSSYSNREARERKDNYIRSVLDNNKSAYKIGIITFAKDPYVAGEMTYDVDALYNNYKSAPSHEYTNSTNISKALLAARERIKTPETSKILILSDGNETDGNAITIIMNFVVDGIKIDTVYFGNDYGQEVQVIGLDAPDYNFNAGDEVNITLTLQSSYAGAVAITLYDNDIPNGDPTEVTVIADTQIVDIKHTFEKAGAHVLRVKIDCGADLDKIQQNNIFYSYVFLDLYDRILIIDNYNESHELNSLLSGNYSNPIRSMNIKNVPNDLAALSQYDQIILMNIANSDMPEGFDLLLSEYVHTLGGGILTVGGNKYGTNEPNAYRREDMNPNEVPSLYQNMLPVSCIDYYPPVAVMLLLDRSGSMDDERDTVTGKSRMDLAKEAAIETIGILAERDYMGVISFSDEKAAVIEAPLTPITAGSTIERQINNMTAADGGTNYSDALEKAYNILVATDKVKTKHIMLVTDGYPMSDSAGPTAQYGKGYNYYIDECVKQGITISVVAILPDAKDEEVCAEVATRGGGRVHYVRGDIGNELIAAIKKDLEAEEIKTYMAEPFRPKPGNYTSVLNGVVADQIPELDGYYGVKKKSEAVEPLVGEFTPIYAQWDYGKGKVGSFMCDLNGTWSSGFMADSTGQRIIHNIIKALLPSMQVETLSLSPIFTRNNYDTAVNVSLDKPLEGNEYIEVTMGEVTITDGVVNSILLDPIPTRADTSTGVPRCTLTFPKEGVYKIIIQRRTDDTVFDEYSTFITFSYSSEYLAFTDPEREKMLLESIAMTAKGTILDDTQVKEVFRDAKKIADREVDPKLVFMIIAIVLFLIDMAVRKFKFKWPWEAYRDYKLKKSLRLER